LLTVVLIYCISCSTDNADKKLRTEKERADSLKKRAADSIAAIPTWSTTNTYNDFACLIAGVNSPGSKYNHLLDSNTAWKKNLEFIKTSWHKLDTGRLEKITRWKNTEFPQGLKSATTVFYPFSGPDFLTAITFFPDMDTLVMLGLEKPGRFPDMDKMNDLLAENYVQDLNSCLTDIFNKSYFITRNMQRQLSNQKVNGILPVIAFFMEETQNPITDVKYLLTKTDSLTKTSTIEEVDYNSVGKESPLGLKINYVRSNKLRTVYYYRYDIANKNFNDSSAFFKRLNSRNLQVTYTKSASYLLYNKMMSNCREMILRKSRFILQDDTGVPYSLLAQDSSWNIKLYGQYTRPVKDFPYMREDLMLKNACTQGAPVPDLPFHLGYHWGNKKDLLILASKKQKV
jgi:hypothetical protein